MKKGIFILTLMLFLLSCENKGSQQDAPSPNLIEKVRHLNDSSDTVIKEEPAVDQNKTEVTPKPPRGGLNIEGTGTVSTQKDRPYFVNDVK